VELELQEFCVEVSFFVEYDFFCIFEVLPGFLGQGSKGGVGFRYEPAYGDVDLSGFSVNIFSKFCQLA